MPRRSCCMLLLLHAALQRRAVASGEMLTSLLVVHLCSCSLGAQRRPTAPDALLPPSCRLQCHARPRQSHSHRARFLTLVPVLPDSSSLAGDPPQQLHPRVPRAPPVSSSTFCAILGVSAQRSDTYHPHLGPLHLGDIPRDELPTPCSVPCRPGDVSYGISNQFYSSLYLVYFVYTTSRLDNALANILFLLYLVW
ncbi:hypothetical protein C8F04DRAFT_1253101 [Mycena alexandri]|uniref:Secreted protein n=1 Tax=Mycena alexandri TaxID=1745969 RepID=A0AAD6T7T0_9AGAR|nr:hypothetical protein C8F04DRAFT_1253101 [Mycena alexandri]